MERKKRGFSQEMLAETSGVSLRTIQRIENNTSKPRPYTLKVIADALNMNISDLIEQQPLIPQPDSNKRSLEKINSINSTSLIGLIIPPLNILLPLIIWKRYKKEPFMNEKAKKIISFQILWLLFSVAFLFAVHAIHYSITGQFVSGRLPLVVTSYGLLLVLNVVFVIYASMQIGKGRSAIYPYVPNLF